MTHLITYIGDTGSSQVCSLDVCTLLPTTSDDVSLFSRHLPDVDYGHDSHVHRHLRGWFWTFITAIQVPLSRAGLRHFTYNIMSNMVCLRRSRASHKGTTVLPAMWAVWKSHRHHLQSCRHLSRPREPCQPPPVVALGEIATTWHSRSFTKNTCRASTIGWATQPAALHKRKSF